MSECAIKTTSGNHVATKGVGNAVMPIETRALELVIDRQKLIHDVNLTIQPGSVTVMMGPNGAGKSLLLRMMHGVIKPTAGVVFCGGKPLNKEHILKQSMVFQRPVLLRRTVAANLDFVLKLRSKTALVTRRDELLGQVGLLHKARQPARLLSGGEQQRLALARVLALQPEVLFLDEPTANLDPSSTYVIEEIVKQIHLSGTKIIFVGHDSAQAQRLGDEIVFMCEGRVVEQSGAREFFSDPESREAQEYLQGRLVF